MNNSTLQIAQITNSQLIGESNINISHIAFDSRNLYTTSETAFIAINTKKKSGEKYILSAIEKGIKVIISENYYPEFEGISWIIVKDSIQFLQTLAKYHLEHSHLKNTIGITGSNGKTIVKEWLYQCLWNETPCIKSPKSFNSQIGLPISILDINDNHELGIFEVGISKPKEMEISESIFSPKIGILTHIGSAHSSNFINQEELIHEKINLFKNSNCIIFNGDNEFVFNQINKIYSHKKLISFGLNPWNDVYISSDYKNPNEIIKIKYKDEEINTPIQQRDEATLCNALAVFTTLKELGFDNHKIIDKINHLQAIEMRLESINGVKNNLIINDSFNLDLDSLIISYQFINQYQKDKKILILTDILDTIEENSVLYPKIAKLTNEQNFDQVFLIGNQITQYQKLFTSECKIFKTTQELIESNFIHSIENHLILLKGARVFEIEKIKNILELQKHDTTLEINLNAIIHNINVHKSLLKPNTKVCAMVKAYSYGLGGYEIAEFLQHHHIDYLGVAYADEGADLRKNGITTPILVMNPEQNSYESIIDYHLEPEIYNFRVLELFGNILNFKGLENYPIHIKIETGMHRLGFKEEEIDELIEKIKQYRFKVASIFSHLSSADNPKEEAYTLKQFETFERISQKIIEKLGYQPIRHILNSAGIANYNDYQYDMVRIGIGMLGFSPNEKIQQELQNVVSFKTLISQVSEIKKGESIGYNRNFIAIKDTQIATIPVGYADGVSRLMGNEKGFLWIKNKKIPIVGNICMDMLMLNLKDLPAKEGEEVILFNSIPRLKNFAEYSQTIVYEVLTSISRRVKRIYIKD